VGGSPRAPGRAAAPPPINGWEPPAPLPTHDEPGAATINTSATVYANPRQAAETPRVGETEPPRVPQQVAPRPRRFLRAAAFGVGGLAAAAVIFYVLPKLSSHTASPPTPSVARAPTITKQGEVVLPV